MYGMIATWRMAKEGLEKGSDILKKGGSAIDALETAIKEVEDFPYYKSVGYGGLPNEEAVVELDAAMMDGTTFDFGAVAALQDIKNPIAVARRLMQETVNNVLVGDGARKYALQEGFAEKVMLSERAKIHYRNRLKEMELKELSPYSGHDTVGMVALDTQGNMGVGTSTSGLFMKKPGRVGDSPIIGSGFYVDRDVGGATATGLGEDLMKGVVSYEVLRLMKEGKSPQEACEKVVLELDAKLKSQRKQAGDISIVALDKNGAFGAATNIDNFSFVVETKDQALTVFRCFNEAGMMRHEKATQKWLDDYLKERMAPLK